MNYFFYPISTDKQGESAMRKIILFGTGTWGGCPPVKEVLSENNIKYMYVDICEGVGKLKSFLKVRDTAPEMQEVREQHRAGIPCLVVDDQVILVNGAEHMQQLIEQYQLKED